jgi:hypothetical protein
MKTPFFRIFSTVLVTVLLAHLLLTFFQVLPGKFNAIALLDVCLFFIFSLGLIIIVPGLHKSPENFSMRFLMLTTIQMLLMLTFILVIITMKYPDARYIGFSGIFVFIFLMAIQSVMLIRAVNKK